MRSVLRELRPAAGILLALSLVTGLAYPALMTAAARLLFPWRSGGSLIVEDGVTRGSALVGQDFSDPGRFWGRPSATGAKPYDAAASGGSNLGPNNPALRAAVSARVAALRRVDPGNSAPVPLELVTASGSGLDPHISPEGARYQAARVARVRGIDEGRVRALVSARSEERLGGLFGAPRVNVLLLNRDLEAVK